MRKRRRSDVMGIYNLKKERGMTSRHALNRTQRASRELNLGHAGTLDPLAEGVLVACANKATKLLPYIQQLPKEYRAVFLLGKRSDSDDIEQPVEELVDPPVPTTEQIEALLPKFVGRIEQRPPAFSALRVEGRRAYELAQEGTPPELPPRTVVVYEIELLRYAYPELELKVLCGSGTYIRALGRDIAAELGTAAVMSGLVRTAVGPFRIEDALAPEEINYENWREHLLPPRDAVPHLPSVRMTADEVDTIYRGQPITTEAIDPPRFALPAGAEQPSEFAGLDPEGNLVSILRKDTQGRFWPKRNLLPGPQAKTLPEGYQSL
ncbi:MAG: tRNA pseudouridine(55) synthase TruB [Planctomycetota bacterium]|nr:MAG: tRNA pseudouridine(55) synthase TruB [Planctomycetota bacterium]